MVVLIVLKVLSIFLYDFFANFVKKLLLIIPDYDIGYRRGN